VSVNDVQKFAVILEGVEIISNLLVRNDIYTTLYLCDNAVTTNEMKRCMVELYTSVLSFLAKAKRYYMRNTSSECHFYAL
jgi:DNA phosphorothioation-dependent restriction protein DptG